MALPKKNTSGSARLGHGAFHSSNSLFHLKDDSVVSIRIDAGGLTRAWGVAVALVFTSCGPSVTSAPVLTSSGRPGFQVECWSERDACDERAGRECPHGYALVDSEERYIPGAPGTGGQMLYRITIACAAPGREP